MLLLWSAAFRLYEGLIKSCVVGREKMSGCYGRWYWRHQWDKWGEIVKKNMLYEIAGQARNGIEYVQTRTCTRCNKTEKREV